MPATVGYISAPAISPVEDSFTTAKIAQGNIECGVILPVDERFASEDLQERLFCKLDAPPFAVTELSVGRVGDKPETAHLLVVPPILSAKIEISPVRQLRLLWREDAPSDAPVSVSWTGRDWFSVTREPASLQESEAPAALRVRDDRSGREWHVPVVDPAGHICWQPPQFVTYDDALAAILDFPIRPAEATDDDGGGDDPGGGTSGSVGSSRQDSDNVKSYALYAAADLIERVSALQTALPDDMLSDWIEHLDRMFRASFPDALIATWREHRIDVFSHLSKPEFRPAGFSPVQRQRYFEVLDNAAQDWGLR